MSWDRSIRTASVDITETFIKNSIIIAMSANFLKVLIFFACTINLFKFPNNNTVKMSKFWDS